MKEINKIEKIFSKHYTKMENTELQIIYEILEGAEFDTYEEAISYMKQYYEKSIKENDKN